MAAVATRGQTPARLARSFIKTSDQKMNVVVISDPEDLTEHIPAWESLAASALESNVFYEPWMLMPALRAYGADKDLRFVLIYTPDPARPHGQPLLCGFFPLERQPNYKRLPVATFSLYKHDYCFLCTPLVRADRPRECLAALFDWLASDCALTEFGLIAGDGPFYQLLADLFNERALFTFDSECFTRAMFRPRADADEYLRGALSREHRKDLRRRGKRLSESGRVQYVEMETDENATGWIEEFLQLEASGWKGEQGTALACKEADRNFFAAVATEAYRRGRLMMLALKLDERTIAQKCNLLAGNGSFAFKIAFDQNYARFSPGFMLEVENIHRLHQRPDIVWMDSCAVWDHSMINRLWLDRRTIKSVLVSTGKNPGDLLVSSLPLLRWINRRITRRKLQKRPE